MWKPSQERSQERRWTQIGGHDKLVFCQHPGQGREPGPGWGQTAGSSNSIAGAAAGRLPSPRTATDGAYDDDARHQHVLPCQPAGRTEAVKGKEVVTLSPKGGRCDHRGKEEKRKKEKERKKKKERKER